jgi:hypothetical protein
VASAALPGGPTQPAASEAGHSRQTASCPHDRLPRCRHRRPSSRPPPPLPHARPAGDCYSSVKNVVLMNWLEEDSSDIVLEMENGVDLNIFMTITKVIENTFEEEEVYYKTPSKSVRDTMKIVNTDKERFVDENGELVALYNKYGKAYYDSQEFLLIDREKFYKTLDENNLKPFWIVFQYRSTTLNFKREHQNFHAEKSKYWIVWEENEVIQKIPYNENEHINKNINL